MPGRSGATPVIWNDSIFLPSADAEKNLVLLCLNRADGSVRWKQVLAVGDRTSGKNNLATPSAVTDGKLVIGMAGTGELAAFDFAGRELWRRSLGREFGKLAFMFLYGSSPLLYEGRLYVQVIQRNPPAYPHAIDDKPERDSYLLCLQPETGKTLWRQVRVTDAREEAMECYTTPLPCHTPNGVELVVVGADAVTAHDPATGNEVWRFGGLNLQKIVGGRVVPSAATAPGFVFACGPKREMLVALRLGARGTLTDNAIAWQTTQYVPDVCTPLYYRGRLFVLDGDRQVLTCYDPATGNKHWQGRLPVREIFNSSPTGADGRLYLLSEEGTAVVLSAGDQFEVLSVIPLGESRCMASVAISDGQLFLRTTENLYCVGNRRKP
jgi:outer membrane protein assembly factor BamB